MSGSSGVRSLVPVPKTGASRDEGKGWGPEGACVLSFELRGVLCRLTTSVSMLVAYWKCLSLGRK